MTLVARDPKGWDEGELILSEYSFKANKDQQFNQEKENGLNLRSDFTRNSYTAIMMVMMMMMMI